MAKQDDQDEEWLDQPSREAIGGALLALRIVCWVLGIPIVG